MQGCLSLSLYPHSTLIQMWRSLVLYRMRDVQDCSLRALARVAARDWSCDCLSSALQFKLPL